jgi:hypothetical protein
MVYRRRKTGSSWAAAAEKSWATCTHCQKRSYRTKESAREALRNLRKNSKPRPGSAVTLGIYRCEQGTKYWHIGHSAPGRANLNDPRLKHVEESWTGGSETGGNSNRRSNDGPSIRSEIGFPGTDSAAVTFD